MYSFNKQNLFDDGTWYLSLHSDQPFVNISDTFPNIGIYKSMTSPPDMEFTYTIFRSPYKMTDII